MANLRVFISSTCYDLSIIRGQLRNFIESIGYEPVMSDYNDVVYDPRTHTHTSCIDEVTSCDIIIVIIGSRFGGKIIPQALSSVDIDALKKESKSIETLNKQDEISITQLEVLKAIETSIPVFAFVDERVANNHLDYEKNKNQPFIQDWVFSSIEKPETAKYIFEFINFLRHRTTNNGITNYSKYQDIENALRRQWSGLFQRMLSEQKNKQINQRKLDALTEQFEDLKSAILTTIGDKNEREVARGVVRFRRLSDFIRAFKLPSYNFVNVETHTWDEFLEYLHVIEVVENYHEKNGRIVGPRPSAYFIKDDNTFYAIKYFRISDISIEWEEYTKLTPATRGIIFDALTEMRPPQNHFVQHIDRPFGEYIAEELEGKSDITLSSEQIKNYFLDAQQDN